MDTYFDYLPKELNYLLGFYLETLKDINNFSEYLNIGCASISWYSYFKEYFCKPSDEFWFYWLLNFDPRIKNIRLYNKYDWKNIVNELIKFKYEIEKINYLNSNDKKEQIIGKYYSLLSEHRIDEIINIILKDYAKEELTPFLYHIYRFRFVDYLASKIMSKISASPKINRQLLFVSLASDKPNTAGYILDNFNLGDEIEYGMYFTFMWFAFAYRRITLFSKLLHHPKYEHLIQARPDFVRFKNEIAISYTNGSYDLQFRSGIIPSLIVKSPTFCTDPEAIDDTIFYFFLLSSHTEEFFDILLEKKNYPLLKKFLLFPWYRERLSNKIKVNENIIKILKNIE